jgi:hypothetical protein
MAESRNVRKEKMRGRQAVPAGSAQVIRTSTRFANSMGRGHLRCHFPGDQQGSDVNSRLSIEHSTISLLGSKIWRMHHSITASAPNAPPEIEKAPGRLTTGALAAPFSPGGSIKAAAEIISVVRKNLTSNHRKDCVAIFAPSRPDFGQYLETVDALTATRAGSARPWAEVAPTSDSRAGFAIRLSFGRRHTCPETLQT